MTCVHQNLTWFLVDLKSGVWRRDETLDSFAQNTNGSSITPHPFSLSFPSDWFLISSHTCTLPFLYQVAHDTHTRTRLNQRQLVQRARVCIFRARKIPRASAFIIDKRTRFHAFRLSEIAGALRMHTTGHGFFFTPISRKKGSFLTHISVGLGTKERSVCNQISHEDSKWYTSWDI